jgi:putative heme-binding domain-containing protein
MPKLSQATTAELVALLEHPSGWRRDTASRLLYERQDRSAVLPLRTLARRSRSPLGRTHALHALAGLNALAADDALAALSDPEPRAREHALKLAERFCDNDPRIERVMLGLVTDPDALVRYQLAFSLGALPASQPALALAALAKTDGADPWVRLAILSSVTGCPGDVFRELAGDAEFRAKPHGRTFLPILAAQTAANRPADVSVVLKALDGPLAGDQALARAIVAALMTKMSSETHSLFAGSAGGRARAILAELLTDARATAVDEHKPAPARAVAVRALRFAPFPEERAVLAELLATRQPAEVQTAAIETLASYHDAAVASVLLAAWPGMSPKLRATAAEAIFARPAWIGAFLDAIENGTVGRGDVDPARLNLLKTYPDTAVRARASTVFAAGLARRQEVVTTYQKALELKGDPGRGKAVFQKNCSSCHRLENVGEPIGADLSAVRDRGLEAVLLNILDPNREVMPQYVSYMLVTTSGRVVTGLITAESANSLTIQKPDGGAEAVLRLDIEELRSTGQSYMPEGLEKQIDIPAMADLLAYLNSTR